MSNRAILGRIVAGALLLAGGAVGGVAALQLPQVRQWVEALSGAGASGQTGDSSASPSDSAGQAESSLTGGSGREAASGVEERSASRAPDAAPQASTVNDAAHAGEQQGGLPQPVKVDYVRLSLNLDQMAAALERFNAKLRQALASRAQDEESTGQSEAEAGNAEEQAEPARQSEDEGGRDGR